MRRVVSKKVACKTILSNAIDGDATHDISSSLNACLFDKSLAFTKFGRMLQVIKNYANTLETFRNSALFADILPESSPFFAIQRDLQDFVLYTGKAVYSPFGLDLHTMISADDKFTPPPTPSVEVIEQCESFQPAYDAFFNSQQVRMIIRICDELSPYKMHIGEVDKLNEKFIASIPGVSFVILGNFDVKNAYIEQTNESGRKLIGLFLHKLFTYGYKLYQEYTTPDMNVEQVVSVVRNAIVDLRSIPELSRCGKAFDMIEHSIDMLKTNFDTYYTDFVQTRSPTTILEHFIIDVSQARNPDKKRSATLAHQFNSIVNYYRNQVQRSSSGMHQADALFSHFTKINSQLGLKNLDRP